MLDLPAGPPLGLGRLPFKRTTSTSPRAACSRCTPTVFWRRATATSTPRWSTWTNVSPTSPILWTAPATPWSKRCCRRSASPPTTSRCSSPVPGCYHQQDVAIWQLPLEATAAARARELATAKLTEWGLTELTFTTELVASELVANAYRYAAGPVTLRLIRTHCLICEVSDASHTSPHLRRALGADEGGRGLFLVAQLTERWGTRYSHDGETGLEQQPLPHP